MVFFLRDEHSAFRFKRLQKEAEKEEKIGAMLKDSRPWASADSYRSR